MSKNHDWSREIEQLIKERRMIRRFATKSLSEEVVKDLIQTAQSPLIK